MKSAIYQKYSSAKQPFLLKETILIAKYICEGMSDEKLYNIVIQENVFQVNSVATRKDLYKTIKSRLKDAPQELIEWIAEGPSELAKFSNLYLILIRSKLLRELLSELILDKLLIFQNRLTRQDVIRFFERKAEQNELIANWSDETFYRSQNYLLKTLMDAGLLAQETKDSWLIQPIYLPLKLKALIKSQGHGYLIKIMLDRSE